MKKAFATTLAGIALVATVAGCGGSSSSSTTAPAATSYSAAAPMGGSNIVQTAVAAGEFKTLVSLVKQAGLAGALSAPGQLTVFAPTDAAFAKVPKATLTELARNTARLKQVLLYHVVKGDVTAAQVVKLTSAKTLEGSAVPIRVENGKVYIGGAQVIKANVTASNGVIHVINTVLIPTN